MVVYCGGEACFVDRQATSIIAHYTVSVSLVLAYNNLQNNKGTSGTLAPVYVKLKYKDHYCS